LDDAFLEGLEHAEATSEADVGDQDLLRLLFEGTENVDFNATPDATPDATPHATPDATPNETLNVTPNETPDAGGGANDQDQGITENVSAQEQVFQKRLKLTLVFHPPEVPSGLATEKAKEMLTREIASRFDDYLRNPRTVADSQSLISIAVSNTSGIRSAHCSVFDNNISVVANADDPPSVVCTVARRPAPDTLGGNAHGGTC
jgi:hypothetical protein